MASQFPFRLGIYFILLISLSYCVASPITLEQRVQQLEQNNVSLEYSTKEMV